MNPLYNDQADYLAGTIETIRWQQTNITRRMDERHSAHERETLRSTFLTNNRLLNLYQLELDNLAARA